MIRKFIETFGEYFTFLGKVFSHPSKWKVFSKKTIFEMDAMGIGSLLIVSIVSITLGAVITMQTAMQIESNWIPKWCVGYIVKTTAVMELCPTIISLLLVGNLGSRITAEIGSMRVTEQIDALEVMGINPASYLVLPKIVAAVIMIPLLTIISIFFALVGGYLTVVLTGAVTTYDFLDGVTSFFRMYDIIYALTKTVVFAFVISSVSSFYGYRITGGALELGEASTKGIVVASFAILILNMVVTQIML